MRSKQNAKLFKRVPHSRLSSDEICKRKLADARRATFRAARLADERTHAALVREKRRLEAETAAVEEGIQRERYANALKEPPCDTYSKAKYETTKRAKQNTILDNLALYSKRIADGNTNYSRASISEFKLECTCTVFVADAEGVGAWETGRFASPSNWIRTVADLESFYFGSLKAGQIDAPPTWSSDLVRGEYNCVFFPKTHPPLDIDVKQRDGSPIDWTTVVIRTTRPDTLQHRTTNETLHRYRSLVLVCTEAMSMLTAASTRNGPVIHALAIVPRFEKNGSLLYGMIVVMERAVCDLVETVHRFESMASKNRSVEQANAFLETKGASFAKRLVKLTGLAAIHGFVLADLKLGNIVATTKGFRLIDFDPLLTVLMSDTRWKPRMLANLLLVSVHVKTFTPKAFSNGFIKNVKDVLSMLLAECKNDAWLLELPMRKHAFQEIVGATLKDASKHIGMTVSAYFLTPNKSATCMPTFDIAPGGKPLVQQLCLFLFGTVVSKKWFA
jgi:hypothetical protein